MEVQMIASTSIGVVNCFRTYWKSIVLFVTPLIFLPLIFIGTQESRCAYVVALMSCYWITEALPLPVTALLPIFLFPFFGILDVKRVCATYFKDSNFLFIGGLMVAVAIEECNLHKRIALSVLMLVGVQPQWLMAAFMTVTALLSMFISNTATTAMMTPIAIAVLDSLYRPSSSSSTENQLTQPIPLPRKAKLNNKIVDSTKTINNNAILEMKLSNDTEITTIEDDAISSDRFDRSNMIASPMAAKVVRNKATKIKETSTKLDFSTLHPIDRNICKAILLSICYSANIGGTGTLTGTGPNLVLRGQLDTYDTSYLFYPHSNTGINFASWMAFAVPPMFAYLASAWLLLLVIFIRPCRQRSSVITDDSQRAIDALHRSYAQLGVISFAEMSTAFWFVALIVMWITREYWSNWFIDPKFISDTCPAIMVTCILFVWPTHFHSIHRKHDGITARNYPKRRTLLTWNKVQMRFPWSVVFLLGGGFALAEGVKKSELSEWFGCQLESSMNSLPPSIIIAVFTTMITFITEVSSNVATASIFVPLLISIAENLRINPLYFALPATIAPSFAYMLPVATPPNAIVYESGAISIRDMAFTGFFLNWICIAITLINVNTWASILFSLNEYPDFAAQSGRNSTCIL